MRSFFIALGLFLGLNTSASAQVFIGVGDRAVTAPPPPACIYPVDNGCSNAPSAVAGSAAVFNPTARNPGDLINQLNATVTDYTTSYVEDTNRPGVDYPVGETAFAIGSLKDPSLPTFLPTGCIYNATANTSGGPMVTCTFPAFNGQTLSGFDFAGNGIHHCVALKITGAGTSATVSQNRFLNNTADCSADTNHPTQIYHASVTGGGSVNFISDTLDGNSLALPSSKWQTYEGACTVTSNLSCNPGAWAFLLAGGDTLEYIAQLNYWNRPDQYNGLGPGITITHSYQSGCCFSDPTAHAEMYEYVPSTTGVSLDDEVSGSTIFITTGHNNTGLALWPINFNPPSSTPPGVGGIIAHNAFKNNLVVLGFGGGGAQTVSVDNTTTVAGAVLTAGVVTGTPNPATGGLLGSGPLFTCNTTGSALSVGIVYDGLLGTTSAGPGGGGYGGTSSQWHMDLNSATITSFIDDGSAYPSPSGVAGNVLSVTADTSLNLLNANGVTVSGHKILSATLAGGTGGVGQYLVNGSASVVGPAVVSAVPDGHLRTQWDIPPGVTLPCAANNNIHPIPWTHALLDVLSPMITQLTNSGNIVDMGPFALSTDIWSQRTDASIPSFTGAISSGNLSVSGATGGTLRRLDLLLPVPPLQVNTFLVSGATTSWVVSPSQTALSSMTALITWCLNPTDWGGGAGTNVDISGVHSVFDMNRWTSSLANNGC